MNRMFIFVFCVGLFLSLRVEAAIILKSVVASGDEIRIEFDSPIDAQKVRLDTIREIIQLSIPGASVYPARVQALGHSVFSKMFAYQYTPSLVRIRFTAKSGIEPLREQIELKDGGKFIILKTGSAIVGDKDKIKIQQAIPQQPKSDRNEERLTGKEQESLLKDMDLKVIKDVKIGSKLDTGLSSGKSIGNPFKTLDWLVFVIALFGAFAFLFKRYKDTNLERKIRGNRTFRGWINSLVPGQTTKRERMIEILSTHHLGPKKSIAVVKIKGRQLVLGLTNDNISLISELDDAEFNQNFDSTLTQELALEFHPQAISKSPGRDRIRKRIEGMKSL